MMEVVEEASKTERDSPVLGDHCYCKVCPPEIPEAMDTSCPPNPSAVDSNSNSPTLTSLDRTQDNFEALLLLLLQAYTSQNQASLTSTFLGDLSISGDALDTLSYEQISALITSNSVNYEVIQQILAQQKSRPREGLGKSSLRISLAGNQCQNGTENTLEDLRRDSSKSPTLMSPMNAESNQQLQQLIHITPQQLQLLQSQVNELLKSQHITLPPDLSPEQQQQLIQTLLLRQLHLQQSGGVANISLKDGLAIASDMKQQLVESNQEGSSLGVTDTEESNVMDNKEESIAKTEMVKKGVMTRSKKIPTSASSSKPSSLSGAEISAYQASGGVGRGRGGRGRGRGGGKSAGGGRRKRGGGGGNNVLSSNNDSKKPPMPYNLFFNEVYSTVMGTNNKMGFSDASKIIAMMWAAMGQDVKKRYYDEHEKLKAQYKEAAQSEEEGSKEEGETITIRSLIKGTATAASEESNSSAGTESPATVTENQTAPVVATETHTSSVVPMESMTTPMENHDTTATGDQSITEENSTTVSPPIRAVVTGDLSVPIVTMETTTIPKDPSLCVNLDCKKLAVFLEKRGPRYCSNECVVTHCKRAFNLYAAKKMSTS